MPAEKVDPDTFVPTSTYDSERTFGSAIMRGKTGRDEVCLGSARSSCVEGLEFFSYHNQTGLIDPIEGTLGLAQNKQMLYSSTEIDIAELFVNELYKKSNIPEATFSFGMMGFNDFD